ncbi:MAG: PilZ domain-containing protein [Cyanobium sp.]
MTNMHSSRAVAEDIEITRRTHVRAAAEAVRPLALQRLNPGDGNLESRWMLADILDISCGGLCLLLSESLQLPIAEKVQLDVRSHPAFGTQRMEAEVRWCSNPSSSRSFTTLGLAFCKALAEVPRLALERRTVHRDPNTEAWAQA